MLRTSPAFFSFSPSSVFLSRDSSLPFANLSLTARNGGPLHYRGSEHSVALMDIAVASGVLCNGRFASDRFPPYL